MFSVITPSFNQGRFIGDAIRSVLTQAVSGVEYIVLDGGSRDETVEVLRQYERSISYWRSASDGGQTAALVEGFLRARGEYVAWLNSDDVFLPHAFEAVQERFRKADAPDVVFGYAVTIDEAGKPIKEMRHGDFALETLAAVGMDITQPAMFVRRAALEKTLPLDSQLKFCMDLELIIKLALQGARFARLPRFLAGFRVHKSAKTSTLQDIHVLERERLLSKLRQDLESRSVLVPSRLRTLVARRMGFVMRGELGYAFLGGRLGMSREAKQLVCSLAAKQGGTTMTPE